MTAGRKVNSQSVNWGTPVKYIDAVRTALAGKICLDPCSNQWSLVDAELEWQLPCDGLASEWNYQTIYVNPPYGSDRERGTTIKDWLRKCANAHEQYGAEVIALIPVAPNTKHWKDYIWPKACAIAFLYDTRLKFLVSGVSGGKGAPMACAMVYWGKQFSTFQDVFLEFGAVVAISEPK